MTRGEIRVTIYRRQEKKTEYNDVNGLKEESGGKKVDQV